MHKMLGIITVYKQARKVYVKRSKACKKAQLLQTIRAMLPQALLRFSKNREASCDP